MVLDVGFHHCVLMLFQRILPFIQLMLTSQYYPNNRFFNI